MDSATKPVMHCIMQMQLIHMCCVYSSMLPENIAVYALMA